MLDVLEGILIFFKIGFFIMSTLVMFLVLLLLMSVVPLQTSNTLVMDSGFDKLLSIIQGYRSTYYCDSHPELHLKNCPQ